MHCEKTERLQKLLQESQDYSAARELLVHTRRKGLPTSEQHEAATQDGPVLIHAGAGTGKTHTLVYRVSHLLRQGVKPGEILLLAFTNKAANELQDRLPEKLPFCGTFHHIAHGIVREHAKKLGYSSDFTILSAKQALDTLRRETPCFKKVAENILSLGLSVHDLTAFNHPIFGDMNTHILRRILRMYSEYKLEHNLMDFNDLLQNWLRLFKECPEVSTNLSSMFRYILVDEYQDVSETQRQLLMYCASQHKNITVVGDSNQSIYGFRGSSPEIMSDFKTDYEEYKEFALTQNFRASPSILQWSNSFLDLELKAEKEAGESAATGLIFDVHLHGQISKVVASVSELISGGTSPEDIAILYRLNSLGSLFRTAFKNKNISCGPGGVTLSSVHSAKGKEWSVVYVTGVMDGYLPLREGPHTLVTEAEERRVFYVALTRAKDTLYLCTSRYDATEHYTKSSFIQEIVSKNKINYKEPI